MADSKKTDVLDAIVNLSKNVTKDLGIETEEKECNGSDSQPSGGDALTHPAYNAVNTTYKQLQLKLKDLQAQLDIANEKVCGLQTLIDKAEHKAPATGGSKRGRGRPKGRAAAPAEVSTRKTLERPTKVLSYAESNHGSSEDSEAYVPKSPTRGTRGRGRGRGASVGRGRARGRRGGRGRPRKDESARAPARRGQPRKNYNEFESSASEDDMSLNDASEDDYEPGTGPKRSRGRARTGASSGGGRSRRSIEKKSYTTMESGDSFEELDDDEPPAKRARGRPARNAADEGDEEEEGAVKRGRGRPRKNIQPDEEDDVLDEDEDILDEEEDDENSQENGSGAKEGGKDLNSGQKQPAPEAAAKAGEAK